MSASDVPGYDTLHEALTRRLSPKRQRGGDRLSSPPSATGPDVPGGLPKALQALLESRGTLASELRAISSQSKAQHLSKARAKREQRQASEQRGGDAVSVASSIPESRFSRDSQVRLKGLDGLLAGVAQALGVGDCVAEGLLEAEVATDGLLDADAGEASDLEGVTDAKLSTKGQRGIVSACKEAILKRRPWLSVEESTGMSPSQAAAASHLLMYAEALQQYRRRAVDYSPGNEVVLTAPHQFLDVPDAVLPASTQGVIRSIDPATATCCVDFEAGIGRIAGVALSSLSLICRKILPVEAVLKYGDLARADPQAHVQEDRAPRVPVRFPPVGIDSELAPPLQDILMPLLEALGGIDPMLEQRSIYGSEEGSQSPACGTEGANHAAARATARTPCSSVELIGTNVRVIDDLSKLVELARASFDAHVDAGRTVSAAGRVGQVVEANRASGCVRVTFPAPFAGGVWLPQGALTRCASDAFLAMGGAKTSITVLGKPSDRDIKKAAAAIAAHEEGRRLQRKAKRGP
eukprot:TRINITY_DN12716_c0_g1_i1.p1 TRINITY_DN12716_c0_g1~~TRINITY_DN12716_c0_g1_i1.p1  ORF type:complete len:522 (+),score=109.40 TRINITY_DN12716_c0_g1_i1:43-1608(+)